MANRSEQQHQSPRDVPPVGRPRGAIWRALQADGVVWEGQVQLVGDDVDLAARMIVTHRRVVFVRGGDLVLDIPRDWLRPEPVLRRDGVLDLFVAMPGANLFDEPLRVPLRMREGHPAAGHIIAMLAPSGVRRIAPDVLSGMDRAREVAPPAPFGGFWDDELEPPHADIGHVSAHSGYDGPGEPLLDDANSMAWPPIEPSDRVARVSSAPTRRPATNAFPITGLLPRDQRKSPWGLILRVGALTLLLATAAALGAGRLNLRAPGDGGGPILTAPSPTITETAVPSDTPDAALLPETDTAIATGVGGAAAQTTEADESATAESAAAATGTPGAAAAPPASSPAALAAAAIIPTPAPTAPPAQEATETPPEATGTGTTNPAAVSTVPADSEATPNQAVFTQPAAVAADESPAQEIVVGPLRVVVETALRAETLPRYGLPPGSGEWALLIVGVHNDGDAPSSLAMGDFRLFDRGTGVVADLDTGTDVIASLAGFDPARTPADTVSVAPGASAEALLLYLLPPGSSDDVALLVGETSMDLAPALALGTAPAAVAPELLEATVAGVLDGSRIAVEIDGLRQTVQYLGMTTPPNGACFSSEAASANTQLVEGQRVWLERQATDRDVWIAGAGGDRDLVAARLLEAGAGMVAPASPDTRYEAWLRAASALGRTNGAGLWSACPDAAASIGQPQVVAPRLAY